MDRSRLVCANTYGKRCGSSSSDSNSANFVDFIDAGRGSQVLAKALVETERRVGTLPEQAELASEDGRNHALIFHARVDGKDLQGCDCLHHGEDGLVDQLTVMVRPLWAALALRDRMAAQLQAPEAA